MNSFRRTKRRPGPRGGRVHLDLELLEDRTVPAALLDPTFNGTGIQTVPFLSGGMALPADATSVAIQPDGKMVVAGTTQESFMSQLGLIRLNRDGMLDTSFGPTIAFSTRGNVVMALEPDGRIVVADAALDSAGTTDFSVRRFTANGSVDGSFGNGGLVTVAFHNSDMSPRDANPKAVAIDASGRILVGGDGSGGFAVARLNTDGSLDPSFGSAGEFTITFDPRQGASLTGLSLQPPTGKIVLSGNVPVVGAFPPAQEGAVLRLNTDGTLDTTFGQAGKSLLQVNTAAMAVDADGKIVVGGSSGGEVSIVPPAVLVPVSYRFSDPVVIRLNADGSFDNTFQPDFTLPEVESFVIVLPPPFGVPPGKIFFHNDSFQAVVIEPDGDIILNGSAQNRLVRLHPDGELAGVGTVPLPDSGFLTGGLVLQSDGKIVATAIGTPALGFIVSRLDGVVGDVTQVGGAFDPSTATWYLHNVNAAGLPSPAPFQYGGRGWVGVIGDWDGNGTETIGAFDPATATWYLRNSNSPGLPDITPFQFGAPGWIPVVGDWNGSGHTGIGVFDPVAATWYLRNELSPGLPDAGVFQYGARGWIPVAGDWTGSLGVGVVDPATATWYLHSSLSAGRPDVGVFRYGSPGWKPVVGDWNLSGQTGIGSFDPSSATWYLRSEASAGPPDAGVFQYGVGTWQPVVGDYLGPAVFVSNIAGTASPSAQSLAATRSAGGALPTATLGFPETNQPAPSAVVTGFGGVAKTLPLTPDPSSLTPSSPGVAAPQTGLSTLALEELAQLAHLSSLGVDIMLPDLLSGDNLLTALV
jgi:uncharacterized delta-60 repeat protein